MTETTASEKNGHKKEQLNHGVARVIHNDPSAAARSYESAAMGNLSSLTLRSLLKPGPLVLEEAKQLSVSDWKPIITGRRPVPSYPSLIASKLDGLNYSDV